MRLLPYPIPGYAEAGGQGISGGDLECPLSLLPDKCAFNSTFDAAVVCDNMPSCRSMMVLQHGKWGSVLAHLGLHSCTLYCVQWCCTGCAHGCAWPARSPNSRSPRLFCCRRD